MRFVASKKDSDYKKAIVDNRSVCLCYITESEGVGFLFKGLTRRETRRKDLFVIIRGYQDPDVLCQTLQLVDKYKMSVPGIYLDIFEVKQLQASFLLNFDYTRVGSSWIHIRCPPLGAPTLNSLVEVILFNLISHLNLFCNCFDLYMERYVWLDISVTKTRFLPFWM